jgi:hypothetical protein
VVFYTQIAGYGASRAVPKAAVMCACPVSRDYFSRCCLRRVTGGVDQRASRCAAWLMSGSSRSQSSSATYADLVGPTGAVGTASAGAAMPRFRSARLVVVLGAVLWRAAATGGSEVCHPFRTLRQAVTTRYVSGLL